MRKSLFLEGRFAACDSAVNLSCFLFGSNKDVTCRNCFLAHESLGVCVIVILNLTVGNGYGCDSLFCSVAYEKAFLEFSELSLEFGLHLKKVLSRVEKEELICYYLIKNSRSALGSIVSLSSLAEICEKIVDVRICDGDTANVCKNFVVHFFISLK